MTHSHDTSTPAMSAETVPSEEFVLVPLAECPIGLFQSADGELCLKTEYGNNEGRIDAYIVSSGEFFWGAAPQTIASQRAQMVRPLILSAPHLAKEGGEAGAVEAVAAALWREEASQGTPKSVWQARTIEAFRDTSDANQERWKRFARAALASLPQPSPALAKGGDAVREALVEPLKWARTTDPSEGSVHYGTGVFGHWYAASRVKPKLWSVNHHIDGKNVTVGLFESLQSAYAAAQSDYDCRIRAALATEASR